MVDTKSFQRCHRSHHLDYSVCHKITGVLDRAVAQDLARI
jgi:hypothetical protein